VHLTAFPQTLSSTEDVDPGKGQSGKRGNKEETERKQGNGKEKRERERIGNVVIKNREKGWR